jgi:hypothetical protein
LVNNSRSRQGKALHPQINGTQTRDIYRPTHMSAPNPASLLYLFASHNSETRKLKPTPAKVKKKTIFFALFLKFFVITTTDKTVFARLWRYEWDKNAQLCCFSRLSQQVPLYQY